MCDTIYGANLAKLDYDAALGRLKGSAANLRCSEVRDILSGLGFKIKDGKKSPGHKMYSHPFIRDFFGGDYNCGHGKDPQVKRTYIGNIINVLEELEHDIKKYLSTR